MSNTTHHSLHWIDKVSSNIIKWQTKKKVSKLHVDDMKTPSGRVHTGALRGVLLHDLVAKALQNHSNSSSSITSTYVFNDMDPMDGLPTYLDKKTYTPHMGKPLFAIPAPPLDACGIDLSQATKEELADFKQAKNFAELYAYDFIHAIRKLGCSQHIIWSHELYQSGDMDQAIKLALDNIDNLKNIYQRVAEYTLPDRWYPFQVFCPECGKVGTTLVTDWDGKQVTFECQTEKVEWATGCGYKGKTTPFGGAGKLLWKVDWPAHWKTMGVTVEGAGKDHTSAGGSRDMANAQCTAVFDITPPFDIPYEWILIRGTKMSSSKGIGTSAREFTELFPPEVGRFLFVNKHYNQVIDFDPRTNSIPDLFDEYDQGARIFWKQEDGDQRLGRSFELSQVSETTPSARFLPRFRDIAIWMQHPEIDLEAKFEEIKGVPLNRQEKTELKERKKYAQTWIERYAPEDFQLTPQKDLPQDAEHLSPEQKEFFFSAHTLLDSKTWDPTELQQALFELAKETIGPRQGFQSIYKAYLGKKSGPRAAWFLLSIDEQLRNLRQKQLRETSTQTKAQKTQFMYPELTNNSLISIDPTIIDTYPGFMIGIAIIEGVTVTPTSSQLQQEIDQEFAKYRGLSNQEIISHKKIASYRRAIKESGIDVGVRRPTMEALLRRLAKGKSIPSINTIADIGNLLAVKHHMSQGLFDMDKIDLPIVFKEAKGGEQVLTYGDTEPITLQAEEICYFDQQGPFAIDLCWRDAVRTSINQNTNRILVATEVVYDVTRHDVELFLKEACEYILQYAGGAVEQIGIITK